VNVDKKEAHIIGDISEGEYFTVNGNRFLSLFESMKWKSVGNLMENERIDYRKQGVSRGLGQLELPEELIDAIFDHIENAQTAFRFGVANTRLLIIGERRIKQLLGEPSWSGDRVICIRGGDGDEEDAGDEDIDLPDGLDASDVYGDFEPAVGCRWDFVSSKNLGQCVNSYTPEFRIAEGLSTPMRVDVQHAEVAWNLTKHVYFRSDAIVRDELPEAWAYWFDGGDSSADKENMLGWTLLFYVTWTNSSIERGKWAGDRIERTDKNVLEARLEEDGCKWTDVSEEAVQVFIDTFNTF